MLKRYFGNVKEICVSRVTIAFFGVFSLLLSILLPDTLGSLLLAASCSGLATMATSMRRWSPVGFVSASIIISLPIWAVSTLIAWALGIGQYLGYLPLAWSTACMVICIILSSKPLKLQSANHADAFALSMTVIVALPMLTVWHTNGPRVVDQKEVFAAGLGGFPDGFYHFGLVQEAKNRQTYPDENPTFAGAPNRYPALLHSGLAGLSTLRPGPVVITLWPILPILMLPPVALGFLAIYRLSRIRTLRGSVALFLGYAAFVFIRIDHFIFPQIQSIAFGLLGLLLYYTPFTARRFPNHLIKFTIIALILVASHTVSATVAVLLSFSLMFSLVLRKKKLRVLQSLTSVIVISMIFWVFNGYTHQPIIREIVSLANVKAALYFMIFPYNILIVVALVLAARQKPVTPLAIAGFSLVMITLLYWCIGLSASSFEKLYFAVFNAPRFAIFGLLLLLPYIRHRSLMDMVMVGSLFAFALLFPNDIVKSLPATIRSEAENYPVSDVRMVHNALKFANKKAILTEDENFAPMGFSACPLYITTSSYPYYASDTIDEAISEQRLADRLLFFSIMTPATRLDYMRSNDIAAVVMDISPESKEARFLPSAGVTKIRGKKLTLFVVE